MNKRDSASNRSLPSVSDATPAAAAPGTLTQPATTGWVQANPFYSLDTGVADAYVVTLVPAPTAYAAGMLLVMKVANNNTGACTVNVNGLGVKSIKKTHGGANPGAADLTAGDIVMLVYDGTNFQLFKPS